MPDQAVAGTTVYQIARITFDWEHGLVTVTLSGTNGQIKQVLYGQNTGGRALMRSFNRPGTQAKSIQRRIMEKLIADGHLAGTISGAPD